MVDEGLTHRIAVAVIRGSRARMQPVGIRGTAPGGSRV